MEQIKELTGYPIEQIANYEGNDSNLLIERLCNPVILEQLVSTFREGYTARVESGRPEIENELDAQGEPKRDAEGRYILYESPYVPPTDDEIREKILACIEEVRTHTPVSFGDASPTSECIPLNWRMLGGAVPTEKQKSIMEAHEKGHVVRSFPITLEGEVYYDSVFGKAFDFDTIPYTAVDYQNDRERLEKGLEHEVSFDEAKRIFCGYMSDPGELIERMSQVKNYFGFKGGEKFTLDHLQYVREHYIKDTGMDNHMSQFFEMIVDEEQFVNLMNRLGV